MCLFLRRVFRIAVSQYADTNSTIRVVSAHKNLCAKHVETFRIVWSHVSIDFLLSGLKLLSS